MDTDKQYAEDFTSLLVEASNLDHLISRVKNLNAGPHRSRELSLAITEIQSGLLWLNFYIHTVDVLDDEGGEEAQP